jgi:hypothetical protein
LRNTDVLMVIDLIEEIKSDLSDAKTNLGGSEEILVEKNSMGDCLSSSLDSTNGDLEDV